MKDSYGTTELINKIDEFIAEDYADEFTEEDEEYVDQVVDYYKQYAEYYGTSFEDFLSQYVGISGVSTEDEFREYVKKDYKKTLAVQKYVGSTISEEELKKTTNGSIFVGKPIDFNEQTFFDQLEELRIHSQNEDRAIKQCVASIVKTYHPSNV